MGVYSKPWQPAADPCVSLVYTQLRRRRWLVAIRPLPATSDKNHRIYIENSNSLTHYYTLLKNTTIEHSERLDTLETCDQCDEET